MYLLLPMLTLLSHYRHLSHLEAPIWLHPGNNNPELYFGKDHALLSRRLQTTSMTTENPSLR